MGDRTPFVVGILAIAGVVAWLVLRDDRAPEPNPTADPAPKTADPGSTRAGAAVSAPAGPAIPQAPTPTPALPPQPPPSQTPTADTVFENEARDDDWAERTEAELATRLARVRSGKLESTECRRRQCRVVIAGSEHDVSNAVADLEGPRGLHGFAQHVLLTAPERADNGTIKLRVFVQFKR